LETLRVLAPEQLRRLLILLAALQFADAGIEVAVARQKIEPAIEIVIEEKRPEFEQPAAGPGDAFGIGHVREEQFLRPLLTKKRIRLIGKVGDEQPIAAG